VRENENAECIVKVIYEFKILTFPIRESNNKGLFFLFNGQNSRSQLIKHPEKPLGFPYVLYCIYEFGV